MLPAGFCCRVCYVCCVVFLFSQCASGACVCAVMGVGAGVLSFCVFVSRFSKFFSALKISRATRTCLSQTGTSCFLRFNFPLLLGRTVQLGAFGFFMPVGSSCRTELSQISNSFLRLQRQHNTPQSQSRAPQSMFHEPTLRLRTDLPRTHAKKEKVVSSCCF